MELVELTHEAVAMHLGHDGGGGDGEGERVAVEEAGLRAGMVETHGVDEQVVGREGAAVHGGQHGDARGLVDVDAVDGLGVHLGDGDGEGTAADVAIEALARRNKHGRGFDASFNPTFLEPGGDPHGWVSPWKLGLNEGPIILMIENHLSELMWKLFRRCPYTVAGLGRAGFRGGWLDRREP